MNKWLINKKLIAASIVVLAVLVLAAIFGSRFVASYYYQNGLSAFQEKRYGEAKQNLSISLKFNRENPLAHYLLGRIALGFPDLSSDVYYPNANFQEVISHHEQAIKFGFLNVASSNAIKNALDDLGISYWYSGNYDKAVEHYLELINSYPEYSFWPRFLVSEHYFERANKPKEALAILKPALDLEQANSEYNQKRLYRFHTQIARLYIYFEDFSNAEKYAKLAIENAGAGDDIDAQIAHNMIALVAGRAKDFSKAESEIRKSNSLANSFDAHNCVLAGAYYLGGNYQKSISIAKKMEKTDTYVYSVCLAALGNSYLSLKNSAGTKKYYQEYLALTGVLPSKNIFIVRSREQFEKELLKPQ